MSVSRAKVWLLPLALLALAGPPAVAVQLEEPEPDVQVEEPPPAGIVEEDLEDDLGELLARAEELFASPQQAESIPLYEQIVALLERRRAAGTLDEEGGELLKQSRARRAEALLLLPDAEAAERELEEIVRLDPSFRLPAGKVTPKLVDLLDRVRSDLVGVLDLLVEPPDAELLLDGEPLPAAAGPREVLAGPRRLVARRPGYTPVEREVEVPVEGTLPLELELERSSAVVRFETRPAGVEVLRDGTLLAVSNVAEGEPEGAPGRAVVDGLATGVQQLELRKPGYRAARVEIEIVELDDYDFEPVVLERALGTVVLSRVPAAARLEVDGEPRPAAAEDRFDLRLELAPGEHLVRVAVAGVGLFERRIELADRQLLELDVALRPTLVLLGVLGDDRVAAAELEQRLGERLGGLAGWAVVERFDGGFELARQSGIDRHRLRALASELARVEEPDWQALQELADKELGGSLYLLAVLSDDLLASRADLWLWSAAPGPARPARRRIPLDGATGALEELAGLLDQPLRLDAGWLGARLIDSRAAGSPVVAAVTADGPAAAAGLRPGDAVTAIGGETLTRAAALAERAAAGAAGDSLELSVGGPSGPRRVTVTLGSSPAVLPLAGGELLDPAVAARLASLAGDPTAAAPEWLVVLNRGVLLMRNGEWESAVRALRDITAPTAGGIGQPTVDYLLGAALLEADRGRYLDLARERIANAATGDARLRHADGPLLAPRAAARLERLAPAETP